MRSALCARRTWVRLLAALPVLVELLALVGLGTLLVLLFALQNGIDDGNISLGLGLMAILLGAVTSLVLAYVEVFRKKLTRRIALVALIPATVGTFAMLGVWIAYLIWGITIWSSVSALIPEGSSFLSSPFKDWQRAWEMNLFLLALPTAYVLWRWFLALSDPTVTPSSLRWRDKFGMLANDRGIVRVAMYHECTYRCKHGCYRRAPGGEDRT